MTAAQMRAKAILDKLKGVEKPIVAELGTFGGALAVELLKQRQDLTLYMVDNWGDSVSQEYRDTNDFHANSPKGRQIGWEKACRKAIEPFKGRGKIIRKSTQKASEDFPKQFFDLVFIDADHSYKGCSEDIQSWEDKVKYGGWLSGHDYENNEGNFKFGVTQAIDEYIEKTNKNLILAENYTWFTKC